MDLALNNLQRLICHKTQTNRQTITWVDFSHSYIENIGVETLRYKQTRWGYKLGYKLL